MSREKWTFIVLRGDDRAPRQYRISTRVLRVGATALGLSAVAFLALSTAFAFHEAHRLRAERLAEENELLVEELEGLRTRTGALEEQIAELSEKDARFRLLAGLETIPPEVRQVGIGGPGLGVPEESSLWPLNARVSEEAFALDYDLHVLSRRARLLAESMDEATDSLEAHRDLLHSTPSIFPAAGVLSSGYTESRRHPILHKDLPHEGIDITAPGGTPVLSAAQGRISYVGWQRGYGRMVEVDHGHGFRTRYAHASKILVHRGDRVERGDPIALVGATGLATAPNLHYEVLVSGEPVDPMAYVIQGSLRN